MEIYRFIAGKILELHVTPAPTLLSCPVLCETAKKLLVYVVGEEDHQSKGIFPRRKKIRFMNEFADIPPTMTAPATVMEPIKISPLTPSSFQEWRKNPSFACLSPRYQPRVFHTNERLTATAVARSSAPLCWDTLEREISPPIGPRRDREERDRWVI